MQDSMIPQERSACSVLVLKKHRREQYRRPGIWATKWRPHTSQSPECCSMVRCVRAADMARYSAKVYLFPNLRTRSLCAYMPHSSEQNLTERNPTPRSNGMGLPHREYEQRPLDASVSAYSDCPSHHGGLTAPSLCSASLMIDDVAASASSQLCPSRQRAARKPCRHAPSCANLVGFPDLKMLITPTRMPSRRSAGICQCAALGRLRPPFGSFHRHLPRRRFL